MAGVNCALIKWWGQACNGSHVMAGLMVQLLLLAARRVAQKGSAPVSTHAVGMGL